MSEYIPKKELKLMFKVADQKTEMYHRETMETLDNHDKTHQKILEQTTATNGKVKRIVIALVATIFFALGLGLKELAPILKLLV